jgi:hypothetical protein
MRSLLILVLLVAVPRPARADETFASRVTGPAERDYAVRADCGWDVVDRDRGAIVAKLPAPPGKRACDSSYDAAVSTDEGWLATAHGLWNLRTRRWLAPLPNGWGFAFSRSGRYLAYVDWVAPSNPDEIYARRGRVVVLDLRKGTMHVSRRVLGPLSNSQPVSFWSRPGLRSSSPAVLITDYSLTLFTLPALEATPVDPRALRELGTEE